MKYKVCPYCGANLDPGEKCTCQEEAEEARRIAERDAKIDALRESLLRYAEEKNRQKDRAERLERLRAQLRQSTTTEKSA